MKKLLLILFIFLSFISSAYANSIQGAFGYKLGGMHLTLENGLVVKTKNIKNN